MMTVLPASTMRYTNRVDRDRLAQEISWVFAARNEDAAAVYLFGSLARGEGGPDSDVDVAVLYGRPVDAGLAGLKLALAGDLETRLGRRVDLVVLDSQPPDLVHRVLRDGLIVVENNRSASGSRWMRATSTSMFCRCYGAIEDHLVCVPRD